MLIFVVVVLILVIAAAADLRLPGDALENMAQAVRGGEDVSDAIVAFCREIIGNAQIPQ